MRTEINNLIDGEFSVECVNIVLKQQTEDNPVVYVGPGVISQNEYGEVEVKLVWSMISNDKYIPLGTNELAEGIEFGTVIPRSAYFDLTATSIDGDIWVGSDIWINFSAYFSTNSAIFNGIIPRVLRETKREKAAEQSYIYTVFCEGKGFKFPANEFSDQGERGRIRNISTLELSGFNCKIIKREKYIEFSFSSHDPIDRKMALGVIKAVEIVSGYRLMVVLERKVGDLKIETTIKSRRKNEGLWVLPSIINMEAPASLSSCVDFVGRFVGASGEGDPLFYRYWCEIGAASMAGIEAFAKAVSINVEGMIEQDYISLKKADQEFVAECKKAKEFIDSLPAGAEGMVITERVKKRITMNLDGAGYPSIKNALYILFDKQVADQWNFVRHKALHGGMHKLLRNTQDLLDASYACLFMFNEILMEHIGFKGERINYAVKGYPTVQPQINVPSVSE